MTTTQVKTEFISEDQQVQQTFDRYAQRITNLEMKLKQMATSSKKGSQESAQGLDGVLGKLLTVQAVAGFVTSAWSDWEAAIGRAAEKGRRELGDLSKMAARFGDSLRADDLAALFTKAGVTRQVGTEVYGAITEADPKQVAARRDALTLFAAPVAQTLPDAQSFSALVGELGSAFDTMAGKDVVDLALALTKKTEGDAAALSDPTFLRAVSILSDSGALTRTQALALGSSAIGAELSPAVLEQIAAKVSAPLVKKEVKTADDEVFNSLVNASAQERLIKVFTDEAAARALGVEGKLAGRVGQLGLTDAMGLAQQLDAAIAGDFAAQHLTEFGRSRAGAQTMAEQRSAFQAEQQGFVIEDEALAADRIAKRFEQTIAGQDFLSRAALNALYGAGTFARGFTNSLTGDTTPPQIGGVALARSLGTGPFDGALSSQLYDLQVQERQTYEEIKRGNDLMREQNSLLRQQRPPALGAHREQ